MVNEWEDVTVVRRIMGDETLLGDVEPETMEYLIES
jgi:hypothetical protein